MNYHPLKSLQTRARRSPEGRAAYILSKGKIEGNFVLVDESLQKELKEKFPPEPNWIPSDIQKQYNIAALQASAHKRPAGYVDFIMSRGKIEGENINLDGTAAKELREKFLPLASRPQPPAPTLVELATNFTGAMAGWAQAGFKIVEREEYERRHTICLACEFWLPDVMLGFGKCKKCGCSKFKLWLATSRCPDKPPRW